MDTFSKKICNYIASEWVSKSKSNRSFAIEHNIDEKTVRKIVSKNGYNVTLITLTKICEAQEIKLSEFFRKLDL